MVYGEAKHCVLLPFAVWLITGNAVVSRLIRLKVISRRRGRYQTRVAAYEGIDRCWRCRAVGVCGAVWKVQRKLFAVVAAGGSAVSKKSEYIDKHGIPARMFNAVRVSLDRKVSAVREGFCSWIACGVG